MLTSVIQQLEDLLYILSFVESISINSVFLVIYVTSIFKSVDINLFTTSVFIDA